MQRRVRQDIPKMEECENLDSETTELQDFQCESSEIISQDDEDEVEELQNSLREVVQDPSVKPKLQCLMVDPSFSMVTVQSEDSGIVWETASSRCSTPWASETSSTSEAYSMEGSGAAGKITIVFDEDKIVRRRTRSGGRSSRLGDRLSRTGSSRSASALGVERLEMAEVSIPNVKQGKTETEPYLEEIKNKDQQLFSLISEGYEILNIRVPSKLPTVDEEESTVLQENLSYLDQTPKIKSRNHYEWTQQQNHVLPEEGEIQNHQESTEQDSSSADTKLTHAQSQKEIISDIDYFEKFTLVDVVVPGATAPEQQEEAGQPAAKPQMQEEIKPAKESATENLSASEDSFVFVSDVEIVGEHLDEVFYGEGAPADALQQRDDQTGGEAGVRMRRESQRSVKESGSVLFGSEETTLTPIYISPGPPKIIDPILLEEPTAMSFMYSDLYEDAVGEKRKSDEEYSEAESVGSEKSYKRLSDSEETDGYLEKFILKDETPTVEAQPDSVEEGDRREGRMMWKQSKFEMTGCLTRVVREEDDDKTKTQEVSVGDSREDSKSAMFEGKGEIVRENERVVEKMQVSMVSEEQTSRGASEEIIQSKLREHQMGDQEVEDKVNRDQTEPPESSTNQPLPGSALLDIKEEKTEHQREVSAETIISETDHLCQTQEMVENKARASVKATADRVVTLPAGTEEPHITGKSEIPADTAEETFSDEAPTDAKTVTAGEVVVTEAPAEVKDPELAGQERFTSAETETPAAALLCEETEAEEILSADVAPVEVITDCDAAVHAVVEVTEKAGDEKNVRTQVQIDLQEAKCLETTDVQTAAPEGEEVCEALTGQIAIEGQELEIVTEADQESEVKTEGETTKSVMVAQEGRGSDKQHEQQPVTDCASTKTKLIPEAKETTSAMDSRGNVHEMANVDDELVLLVPKGQAVEMDIEISQWADRTADDAAELSEPDSKCQDLTAPHTTTIIPETLQASNEETMTARQLEAKAPDREETLPCNELDNGCSSPVTVEEVNTEEQKAELDFEKDEDVFSPLRSFSPQEDLSGLHREDIQTEAADVEQQTESHKVEDAMEIIIQETLSPETDLYGEDTGQEMQPCEAAAEAPEVFVEELEYEVICAQDAKEMLEPETQRDAEEPEHESKQETVKIEVPMEEGKVLDLSSGEELIEADYDIIDAEEERQARLAAELQGMDWFCLTCGYLLSEDDCVSGEHHSHDMTGVHVAYEEIKERLSDWISELQGRSENIEDLVSELELAYNSVEDHCVETEAVMQTQNEEMMALVMEQYNNMSISMEEEKKAKLEQLYDQIVSFQESIDSAKATLDTTAREAETEARSSEDIYERLKAAMDAAMSLELGPKGLLVFEDYAKGNTSSSHLPQRKGIPVPQSPTLQPQEPGSATSTSVTVYWRVSPGDVIDCFQVYCMEDPQGVVSEEYRVTVKESNCVLEDLEPDKTYKVWVMAVNYTGCSLPSERLSFRTAPSVPMINTEHCTVMWDAATLRWSSTKQTPEQTYTLEYCRQYELEGEGLRSISGIKSCEQKVLLQPNENYLFYIKAVNEAGASEQSEAALISTKGTRFHLLKASAHHALKLSADQTTLHYSHSAPSTDRECPSILGELLMPRGHYYWETIVSESTAYRIGVASSTANRNSPLGENNLSWCLQCIPTPSGCSFRLLHNRAQCSVFVTEKPKRVGTLLDYQLGRLSFYNAQSGQLLGTFCQRFTQPCHPALALEMLGSLEVSMVLEVPEFTKDS